MNQEHALYLSDIRIDRLGSMSDQSLTDLSPALNIVYGPNGSGKSTFRNAILFGLYGLPQRLPQNQSALDKPLTYFSPSSPLRQVTGTISKDGNRHHFTQSSPDGKPSKSSYNDIAGEDAAKLMLEDIERQEYSTVWNISISDLQSIDPGASNEAIDSRTASTVFATVEDPSAVQSSLAKGIESQEKERVGDPDGNLKRTITLLKSLEAKRRELEEASEQGLGALSELAKLETEKKLLAPLLEQHSDDRASAERDQIALKAHHTLQEELDSEKEELQHQISEASQGIAQINPDEYKTIILQGDAIRTAHAQQSDIETSRSQLQTTQHQIEEKSAEIVTYGELPAMPTGPDLESLAEKTRDLGQTLRDKRSALSHAEHQLEALRVRRAEHESNTELPADSMPKTKLRLGRILGGSSLILFSVFIVLLGLMNIFDGGALILAGVFGVVLLALGVIVLAFPAVRFSKFPTGSPDNGTGSLLADLVSQERQSEISAAREGLAFSDAQDAWYSHLKTSFPGASLNTSPDDAQTLVTKVRDKSRLVSELRKLERTEQELSKKISEWEERVAEIYSALENSVYLPALTAGAQPLMSALETALDDRRLYLSLAAELKNLEDNLSANEASSLKLADKFQGIFLRYPDASDYDSCFELITIKIDESKASQQRLLGESDEITVKITELCSKIEKVSNSEELQETRDRIGLAKARIETLYPAYLTDLLSAKLLKDAETAYFAEHAPNFEEQASAIFHRITEGLYTKVEVSSTGKKQQIVVTREDLEKFSTHELSRGTADQLYIALRIGLLLAYSSNGKSLPVVLDDILSTSDINRRKNIMDELLRLAEHRQIIFFTHSKSVADALTAAAKEKNIDTRSYELWRTDL